MGGSALPTSVVVGVVGAGAMGAGIAQVASVAGHSVLLFDVREGAAQAAVESIGAVVEKLAAKGKISVEAAGGVRQRLKEVGSLSELAGCGLVVEAIVEKLEAKRELFRTLEKIVREDALLATNTSSISITEISAGLRRPERLVGMHFFNPAPVMPLVEIISGAASSAAAAEVLHATAARWGKVPVYAKSSPGFIVNRVARPFYGEALRVLDEGGTTCATIDAVMREAGGFRMGPFELMDLIGHDVNYSVTKSVFDGFNGDERFTPSQRQLELVNAGFLGRKTGRGFYLYGEGAPVVAADECGAGMTPRDVKIFGGDGFCEVLATRLGSAGVRVVRAGVQADGRIAECDGCVLYSSDGRTATMRGAANGVANTVVVDRALDHAKATRLAIAAAEQSDPCALDAAAGLLQAAGYSVSAMKDLSGMILLRTVAMLANEAADAVDQGVCSVVDCDLAMRKGVNYPLGPLEWADKIGVPQVVAVLEHMHKAYGGSRYRVSPLLQRTAASGGALRDTSLETGSARR